VGSFGCPPAAAKVGKKTTLPTLQKSENLTARSIIRRKSFEMTKIKNFSKKA